MAVIENTYSLKDVASRKDPDGSIADVAEILMQSNSIVNDMPMYEGNMDVGERITVRKSLGNPKWKRYNEHVKPSVSRTSQVDEVTGHLEDWSEIDCDLADKAGNRGEFLMREAKPKMQAMADEMARTIVYGSLSDDPKTFNGFMTRLSTKNEAYMNGNPVVLDAGGTSSGALASMLFVGWGDSSVYGIYPKGSNAGLKFEDKGKVTSQNEDGYLDVYQSKFSWDCGLAVKDYRYILRVANIDVASLLSLTPETAKTSKLYMDFMQAVGMIPNPQTVRLTCYCPRQVWIALSKVAAATGNRPVNQGITEAGFVTSIMGVPVKMQDTMLTTEAQVTK